MAKFPAETSSFAATQALWRFLNNDRVDLPALAVPLHEAARQGAATTQAPFLLLVHDFTKLDYAKHRAKVDQCQLTHAFDRGYRLRTALLLRADDGAPLAPMELELTTADGGLTTRASGEPSTGSTLDQVHGAMDASREWDLPLPLVHVADSEFDSVGHFRAWDQAQHKFLVRADDRRVQWQGDSKLLSEIAAELYARKRMRKVGKARYKGQSAQLWVVETEVTLTRPAKTRVPDPAQPGKTKQIEVPGRPLTLRLVVVQVRDRRGRILSQWLLLSNVPHEWADTTLLAHCYYWRWRIESYYKLLKSAGLELECWQQRTALAVARRLLIASMACVLIWQLERDESPEAAEFREILVKLSGRQMSPRRPYTSPALLAGLFVLLSMLQLLEHYDLETLRDLAQTCLPLFMP